MDNFLRYKVYWYAVIPPSNYGIIIFGYVKFLGVQFEIDPPSNQSQPIPSSNPGT